MEFERRKSVPPSINLSALIDIAFILVIFIVLGATFEQPRRLQIQLPSATAETVREEPKVLRVEIASDGAVLLNEEATTVDMLEVRLRQLRPNFDRLVIYSDKDAPVQSAIRVLDAARSVSFPSAGFATVAK